MPKQRRRSISDFTFRVALEAVQGHNIVQELTSEMDQGAQPKASSFTSRLGAAGIRLSMDGRSRAVGSMFLELLWGSRNYEHLYPMDDASLLQSERGLRAYLRLYNEPRLHQRLG